MAIEENRPFKFILLLVSIIFLFSCSKESDQQHKDQAQGAKKISGGALTLYNWEEYIGSKTLENFEKETGIHVNEIYFEDEEEILGAAQSRHVTFDLAVASDDLIREMREAKMLSQLDHSKIPNLKYVGEQYRARPYDPEQKYSVPYLMGTTGMVVNKKYIKEDADSWSVLFDKKYKGRLAMLNNGFEVIAAVCKLQGYSINTTNRDELDRVKEILVKQRQLIKGYYDVVRIKEMLIKEEIWAAHIYSGEGLVAVDENENLDYVIPREGAPLWIDHFVMPMQAKHKEEAHMFLNYILRPDVNASIASELWYATPNEAATPLMDPEVVKSTSVYPPPEVMARCEFFKDVGEGTPTLVKIWNDLLAID
jgi:spermidine/putrescine-binding protein